MEGSIVHRDRPQWPNLARGRESPTFHFAHSLPRNERGKSLHNLAWPEEGLARFRQSGSFAVAVREHKARKCRGMGILPMTPPRPRWLFWTVRMGLRPTKLNENGPEWSIFEAAVATLPLWEPEARFRLDGLGTPGPLWHGHPAHEMAVPPAPGAET